MPPRLKVFIDCSNTWCDLQHIKSEINLVDYLYDNTNADVHVLITSQYTGSGGSQYHLIFFGNHQFSQYSDTIRFYTDPDATDFEERDLLLHYIEAGLVPFILRTSAIRDININLKSIDTMSLQDQDSLPGADPWKNWVMRAGAGGYFNADANYKNSNYDAHFTANHITQEIKTGAGIYFSKNKSTFEFDESDTVNNFVVNNHNWYVNHYIVKSINSNWSWSYEIKYSQNTFSNNKGRLFLLAAAEYNIFPYDEVNHKLFTISYGLTARKNTYYDTTIYNKTGETLLGHRATAYLSLNQKWGNSYAGITYHNYFNNWKLYNLGLDLYTSVRITGGLSFHILAFGGFTRDQVYLQKGDATAEEVLARRRQLASGYNFFTSLGVNFRFGSKTNNVVNPRFDRSSAANTD